METYTPSPSTHASLRRKGVCRRRLAAAEGRVGARRLPRVVIEWARCQPDQGAASCPPPRAPASCPPGARPCEELFVCEESRKVCGCCS